MRPSWKKVSQYCIIHEKNLIKPLRFLFLAVPWKGFHRGSVWNSYQLANVMLLAENFLYIYLTLVSISLYSLLCTSSFLFFFTFDFFISHNSFVKFYADITDSNLVRRKVTFSKNLICIYRLPRMKSRCTNQPPEALCPRNFSNFSTGMVGDYTPETYVNTINPSTSSPQIPHSIYFHFSISRWSKVHKILSLLLFLLLLFLHSFKWTFLSLKCGRRYARQFFIYCQFIDQKVVTSSCRKNFPLIFFFCLLAAAKIAPLFWYG